MITLIILTKIYQINKLNNNAKNMMKIKIKFNQTALTFKKICSKNTNMINKASIYNNNNKMSTSIMIMMITM